MFKAKTTKIAEIAKLKSKVIKDLENLLKGTVNIYIDYANIKPWSEKLNWHIDLKRLKQFLDSFNNINEIKFYHGTLEGDEKSEEEIKNITQFGYKLKTKPVKLMKLSIDISSIRNLQDTSILSNFIKKSLLRILTLETIEYLNRKFQELNKNNIKFIEDRKCNFDVEIGVDMLLDNEKENIDTSILWSGDSDFADPVNTLLKSGKKVILMATTRRVSKELNVLQKEGLFIFDIQRIKEFICWKREMQKSPQN